LCVVAAAGVAAAGAAAGAAAVAGAADKNYTRKKVK
jgi:hypothetical protein